MITQDFYYSWAYEPMVEVANDPLHSADMTIVEQASFLGFTEEAQAAVARIRARSVWCYEEGGRRYRAALAEYRTRPAESPWWQGAAYWPSR